MVDFLDFSPEEEKSLLGWTPDSPFKFLQGYPSEVSERFMEGASTLPQDRQAGALQMLSAPVAPFLDYAYKQAAHLLGPGLNRMWESQHESQNRALEKLGLPTEEYQDITREQLITPLAMVGSVLRGSPQWYSALRKAIKDAKQDKGQIGYWRGQIKNTPGATSEAARTGFDKRLSTLYPEENITKGRALSLLEPIELKETVLGRLGYNPDEGGLGVAARYEYEDRLRTAGGTNYREILIQLPKRHSSDYWYNRQNEYRDSMLKRYGNGWRNKAADHELRLMKEFEDAAELAKGPNRNFTEGHWTDTGQENTLGHLRLSNLTANNLKSLHSDEYQLDWWQQAERARRREIGRLSDVLDISEKEAAKRVPKDYGYITKPEEVDADFTVIPQTGEVPDEPFKDKAWKLLFKRHLMEAINDPDIEAITWTTGKTQTERNSLSRLVERIDFAYDLDTGKYSITTFPEDGGVSRMVENIHEDDLPAHVGDELADRFITHVDYHGGADQYQVYNKVSNNKGGTFPTKEAAQEWIDDTYKRIRRGDEVEERKKQFLRDVTIRKIDKEDLPTEVTKSYSGEELDIGGKFVKFIYDNKAPQFFNKLLKEFKMPAARVGGESRGYIIGHPERGFHFPESGEGVFESEEEARDYIDRLIGNRKLSRSEIKYWEEVSIDPVDPDEPEVWQQRITDEMREKFKEGMSLTKREQEGLLGSYA